MKARTYECVLVLDPGLDAEKTTGQLERFQDQILHHGGVIRKWDRWGKKRLAYEINHKQYGYYVAVAFDAEPAAVRPLERYLRLSPVVLRHLTVLMEKRRIPAIDPSADLRSSPEAAKKELPSQAVKEKEVETSKTSSDDQTEVPLKEEKGTTDGSTGASAEEVTSSSRGTT